jgi:hypothetical protein
MEKLRLYLYKILSRSLGSRVGNQNPEPASAQRGLKGQAFIELALVLPVLIMLVLGVVELSLFVGRYLDLLDLTREAARFASVRDPFELSTGPRDCSNADDFNFFFHTACIFSPPAGSPNCNTPSWCPDDGTGNPGKCFCNGLNPYLVFDPLRDDIVISAYTVTDTQDPVSGAIVNKVTNVWPASGYWALSNPDGTGDPDQENWKKDCEGTLEPGKIPHFTVDVINSMVSSSAPPSKGFVAVEFYYCYEQALNIPIITDVIPNPLRLNAYTLMPLPEAAPTPTPIPTPIP